MSWWWELFDERNMTPYFRGVRMITDEMIKAGNGSFIPFSPSSGLLESYGVRCGNKYFVYLLNNSDTVMTTPVAFSMDGVDGVRIRLSLRKSCLSAISKISVFDRNTITATVRTWEQKKLVLIVTK